MIDIFSTIFWVIIVLGVLVFFHELGHFIAAKLTGIRVERFSIGFPPRLFGKKIGDTDYCVQLTPLGGYCKMSGMIDESLDPEGIKGEPWEFMSKPTHIRMFVLLAGPLMNFIVAVLFFALHANIIGIEYEDSPTIGSITQGLPAEQAGLLTGDMITAIDGTQVESWIELTEIIRKRPLETVTLKVMRNNETFDKQVTIAKQDNPSDEVDEEVGVLGIGIAYYEIGFFKSIETGFVRTGELTWLIAVTIKSLIFGNERLKDALGGPIKIAQMTNEFRKTSIAAFIFFVAFLSLNLGFMNLLPIPVLDGGHLMILMVEGLVKKQLPVRARLVIQQIGMALLLALMIFIIFNDIMRISSAPG
ncbi:hypothetical protein AMJ80_05505 [bacterium SM23_31]|nr:MAG: hypothetical protein AMJ80_05505 [bacterium SM23_31]